MIVGSANHSSLSLMMRIFNSIGLPSRYFISGRMSHSARNVISEEGSTSSSFYKLLESTELKHPEVKSITTSKTAYQERVSMANDS